MSVRQEVLSVGEESRWREALEEIGQYDFYHLPSYHRLEETTTPGDARLLVYGQGDHLIAFPLLLRAIDGRPDPDSPRTWQDATSVYGYVGPVASPGPVPEQMRTGFQAFLAEFFIENGVVCAFTRMHPLLEQTGILVGYGLLMEEGHTLSIDLSPPEEAQWSAYRRNHRTDIARLRARGVTCSESGINRLNDFIAIYYDNMDRVRAPARYYFGKSYLERLLTDAPGMAHLFICEDEGRPIGGGIFTLCNGIVQWHLCGTVRGYDGPPPAKLLLDVARRWARDTGAHTLHLGGGVGGNRDSLYRFKRGFTDREHAFATWRCVANDDAYMQLTKRACSHSGSLGDFFPAYRHPVLSEPSAATASRDPRGRSP